LTEITAEGLNSIGLRKPRLAADLEITTEHRVPAFGLVDGVEVFEDAFFESTSLLAGKLFILNADGVVDVAQFVEETTLHLLIHIFSDALIRT